MTGQIQLKRVYDRVDGQEGASFLVERLWPRGVKKSTLARAQWLKEVAPSAELRQWFGHDPQRWEEFRRRYSTELKDRKGELDPILEAARKGMVTLLYSSHDSEHNNAVALKQILERKLRATRRESPGQPIS